MAELLTDSKKTDSKKHTSSKSKVSEPHICSIANISLLVKSLEQTKEDGVDDCEGGSLEDPSEGRAGK